MSSNKVAIALILSGLIPLAMSMQAIFLSGSEVKEFQLKGREGETEIISLQTDMNPVRLLITIDYGRKGNSTIQRYIEYLVTAKTGSGSVLWQQDGRASVSSDKKIISDQSYYSSLQTFDIDTAKDVLFEYQIKEANLRYKGGHLTLKRNVTPHRWSITIVGLVLLVAGILIFANNQRTKK